MALYGKIRDIRLFKAINKELLNNVIDTKIDVFRFDIIATKDNIYGESEKKIYKTPIRLNALISVDEQSSNYEDFGYDIMQTIRISFSRDEVVDKDVYIDVGDIIHWNNNFWELTHKIENQLFMKRNPNTNKDLSKLYGWNVSIIFTGHLTKRNLLNIEHND